jgi:NitT/TauT family transport system substrate-binding protein
MMRVRQRHVAALGIALVLAVTAACSQGGPTRTSDGSVAAVLRTDFKFNGYVAPFALGLQRGYYRDAGIDLTIEQGQGSTTTVQTVASGGDTFGLADVNTLIKAVAAQNVPVKAAAVYLQKVPTGVIALPAAGYDGTVQGLRGRPVISSPGNAELTYLDASLAAAGMTRNDVDLRLVDTNARIPTFLRTPGAVLLGFSTGDLLRVQIEAPDATYKSFEDFGITSYGTGLIVADKTAEADPDLVKGFVTASRKAWQDAIADPKAAVDAALALYPDLDRGLIDKGLQVAVQTLLTTPRTKGKPLGATDQQDWTDMLKLLRDYAGLQGSSDPTAYHLQEFDNA